MVNKKVVYGLVGGLAAVVVAATAWFFLRSKKDAYCNVIPSNAVMVARMSPAELLSKNDVTLDDFLKSFGVDKSDKKQLKKFLDCGIDFTSAFYLFVNEDATGGLVFGMNDADDLKEYLENNDTKEIDVDQDKETGYYTAELQAEHVYFCFSDEKGLVYASDEKIDADDVLKLMDQDEDESILETDLYKQLIEADKSMAVNMNYQGMVELAKKTMSSRDAKELKDVFKLVPDCNMLFAMDIVGSEAKATIDIFPNTENAKKDLDKLMGTTAEVSGDLADLGIKHPLAWCTFAFPGNKIYEGMKKIPFLKDGLAEIERELDVRGALSSFNGDVTIAVNNNLDGDMPEMLLLAKTENNKYRDALDLIAQESRGSDGLVSDGGGDYHFVERRYSYNPNDSISYDNGYYDEYLEEWVYPEPDYSYEEKTLFYIGNSNNRLIVTNMSEFRNSVGKSSALDAYKNDIKGSTFFGYVDVHEILKKFEESEHMSRDEKDLFDIWKKAKDVTLLVRGTHGELTFRMDGIKIMDAFLKTGKIVSDL